MDDTNTEQDLMTMTMSSSNGGDEMSTSTSSSTNGSGTNGCGKKATITSPDPTSYVAKARVTRPTPPPPSYNPMQFVQIKPCNLYQTAQEQLKKAEEVKKLKEVKKEEPEEWQNNLDNWKSSRRKRVEHIIDRVVEVKKLELEEHDRMRRKSKTFSEMIEERAERGGPRGRVKLATLAVYNEDEANDLSDLGIGTSSASGKSSLSEDYDNNSVMSDNAAELDRAIGASENQNKNHTTSHHLQQQQQQQHEQQQQQSTTREYISSPGYDTSSSTAPASSPDPCEYTYEGAIQDYKARVTRAATGGKLPSTTGNNNSNNNGLKSKETSPENEQQQHQQNGVDVPTYPTRRGSKIEDRLIGFEVTSPSDHQEVVEKQKVDVPKIDISKRKEIFESQAIHNNGTNEPKSNGGTAAAAAAAAATTPTSNGGGAPRVVLRERFKFNDAANNTNANGTNGNADELPAAKKEVKRLSGDITSIRDRMQSLEQQKNLVNATKIVDVPVPPLKERLSSLQNAVTKEDVKKPPVALIDARQLEIMKNEEARMKQQRQVELGQQQQQQQPQQQQQQPKAAPAAPTTTNANIEVIVEAAEADRDDSGIHTSTDDIELLQKEQEQQLNEAIAALALEEKQLEEAANAVNQIEAEFAELTDLNPAPLATASPLPKLPKASTAATTTAPPPIAAATTTTNENTRNMEFSVSSTNSFIKSENPSSNCVVGSHNNDNNNVVASSTSTPTTTTTGGDVNVNVNVNDKNVVLVSGTQTQTNLRRKPSNEMVHHRNLLKMFKETFKNDVELDEEPENETEILEQPFSKTTLVSGNSLPNKTVSQPIPVPQATNTNVLSSPNTMQSPIQSQSPITQVFDFTGAKAQTTPTSPVSVPLPVPLVTQKPPSPLNAGRMAGTPPNVSMIPRAVNPTGKPPMSPKSVRYNATAVIAKLPPQSPSSSPTPQRKPDSQFSINGRVEIFNSKQLEGTNKPPTPTLPTKRIQLAQIPVTATRAEIGLPTATALHEANEAMTAEKSMPTTQRNEVVNEPRPITTSRATEMRSMTTTTTTPTTATEVVICAPPVTIVNPDELPKPNTVKALSSCFAKEQQTMATTTAHVPPVPPPKPLPRSRIPQITPPQSPTPPRRNQPAIANNNKPTTTTPQQTPTKDVVDHEPVKVRVTIVAPPTPATTKTTPTPTTIKLTPNDDEELKKLSIISNSSTNSSDYAPVALQTAAVVHTPPQGAGQDPLAPNDAIKSNLTRPAAEMPPLVLCAPNESSLFKLAASTPTSPQVTTPGRMEEEIALCASFLNSQAPKNLTVSKEELEYQRQQTVEELPCDKIDVRERPADDQVPCTGFQEVSDDMIRKCDGYQKRTEHATSANPLLDSKPSDLDIALCESFLASLAPTDLKVPKSLPTRQKTVEELPCAKVDVHKLPPGSDLPSTGYQVISSADVKRCDNLGATPPTTPKAISASSKPGSPIMAARAAHSKALIDTCEKIIAEERLASSQMKSTTLPVSPKATTPHMQRKSKIPKPIPCCIGSSGSMNQADYVPAEGSYSKTDVETPSTKPVLKKMTPEDENVLIARTHVVETQIKVTTTTPPTSPKPNTKSTHQQQQQQQQTTPPKEKKTKNIFDFLRRNFGHHDESAAAANVAASAAATQTESTIVATNSGVDVVKMSFDEIHKVDNSKFYVPSDEAMPPPLPKTPAPCNIEITKTITTDEILEEHNDDLALSKEINDMLDDELNKLGGSARGEATKSNLGK